jgi:hypothetical protein
MCAPPAPCACSIAETQPPHRTQHDAVIVTLRKAAAVADDAPAAVGTASAVHSGAACLASFGVLTAAAGGLAYLL